MDLNSIEQEALNLDVKSRGRLAARLLESLDELSDEENERLWAEEAIRRNEEIEAGKVTAIPVDEVLSKLRSRRK